MMGLRWGLRGVFTVLLMIGGSATTSRGQAVDEAEVPVLKVRPAKEPIPALRYRFWPHSFELESGNAFVRYQRAILLSQEPLTRADAEPESIWMKYESIDDMPINELRDYLADYQDAIQEVRIGGRLADVDYNLGVERLRGPQVVELLLPEYQYLRRLARLLVMQIRVELAEGRVDDALATIQSGFRLGEATGQASEFLVTRLVGIAITGMMLSEVQAIIERPDCPNLYWAVATIPDSAWEVAAAIRFESSIMERVFPALVDLPEDHREAGFWRERLGQVVADMQRLQTYERLTEQQRVQADMLTGLAIVGLSAASKKQLLEAGLDAERVERMSPAELVVRASARSLREVQDDMAKWGYLPTEVAGERPGATVGDGIQQRQIQGQIVADFGIVMAGLLMPAIRAVESAGLRTQQSVHRLATIEAVRDHVARTGELPESLDELAGLPAWPDPLAQAPFGYRKLSDTKVEITQKQSIQVDPNAKLILEFEIR